MKIGVFIPNWIGDAAMCTPTLRALRRQFAGDSLTGIMRPYVADVLAGTPWLDSSIYFNQRSKNPAERSWAVLRQLRNARFDAIVLLTNSFRTGLLAWASGAPLRAGYVRYNRGPLLTHKLYCPRLGRRRLPSPVVDAYLQLAYALGCAPESPRIELATLPADEAAADAIWRNLNLPAGERVVVLNSSGAYGAAKLWPSDYFAKLARRIAGDGFSVLVICGPSERSVADQIVRMADHPRVVGMAGESLSIGLSKACIRRSRLIVTTDSGPRFFAVAFGVPSITLFGPTDMAWTRTHSPLETYLHHKVPCGPCNRRVCPLGHHDCMRLLTVERVYAAVAAQLNGGKKTQAA